MKRVTFIHSPHIDVAQVNPRCIIWGQDRLPLDFHSTTVFISIHGPPWLHVLSFYVNIDITVG